MNLRSFLAKLNLSFSDLEQEAEYLKIKIPLLKNFLSYLIICIVALLIPLTIYFFFIINIPLLGFMSIGTLLMAVMLFAVRNFLGKWLEYFVIAYLLFIVLLIIINLSKVLLSLKSCESFYGGYAFALLHRILGYRVVNVYSMISFHVVSLTFRLVFLYDHNVAVSLCVSAVEVATMCLSIKSELGERSLFDSLYKSKQQLLKFKHFLTEHLPNQMVIFAKDNSCAYFMNDAFKKTFECKEVTEAHKILSKFALEKETIEKSSFLLNNSEYLPRMKMQQINLDHILRMISKSTDLFKDSEILSFQAFELESIPETINTQRLLNHRDSSEEEGVLTPGRTEKPKIDTDFSDPQGDPRRTFKVKIFLLPWDGKEAIAVILDDITQQKTIMELQVADRNKDLVIAMVSHELRTPLNGMLGLIDIIKKKVNDNEVASYLNACRNSGVFLLNLVNSILDMSQIKNKKLKLVYTKVSIIELLEEVKSLFESFCTTKNLYLNIKISQNVPKFIVTDKSRLSQILINLLGNAFKFTFEGGITIRVNAEAENPTRLLFYIQDTGLGIKKEDQEKLFKLFGRLEQQDKNVNTHGVGLGLTISNTLAMLLNPSENQGIRVESELGKGSTFFFLIESDFEAISNDVFKASGVITVGYDQTSFASLDEDLLSLASKISPYTTSKDFKFNQMRSSKIARALENCDTSTENSSVFKKQSKKCSTCLPAEQIKELLDNKLSKISRVLMPENISEKGQQSSAHMSWCLIVDDNPFNIMVARHIMQEKNYKVKTALNGKEAIQEVKNHYDEGKVFRVVLMDCQMPVMDGYEATRLLKDMMKKREIKEFPIIALTANNRNEEHERLCKEAGMRGSIAKPLQVGELDKILERLVKNPKQRNNETVVSNKETLIKRIDYE